MTSSSSVRLETLAVAVPGPFHTPLWYTHPTALRAGIRVKVPLGKREVIGITVTTDHDQGNVSPEKLKAVLEVLDTAPLLTEPLLALADWMQRYYLHEFSSPLLMALPTLLRKGESSQRSAEERIQLTIAGESVDPSQLKRAPKQQRLVEVLQRQNCQTPSALRGQGFDRAVVQTAEKKGLLTTRLEAAPVTAPSGRTLAEPLALSPEQAEVLANLRWNRFAPMLLDGITGSGKTEVYLQAIEQCLQLGKRALVLVPEIGLTPQLEQRFRARFTDKIVALNSGITEKQRLHAWLQAQHGEAAIVVGTRSAVMTPMPDLGIIIVDEEHDISFKQQDGLRYHARDVAMKRAQIEHIPILLGSATPALETLHLATTAKIQHGKLTERAGKGELPAIETIDMRKQPHEQGLSDRLRLRIEAHLSDDNQVLIYLNRRGYAPSWFCQSCGWIADCTFCDSHLTYHRHATMNICHHCGHREPPVLTCPNCHQRHMTAMGTGTERAEDMLSRWFPDVPVIRFDRDAVSSAKQFKAQYERIQQGGATIIIGTQMLAKGHHFEGVTLVGIWDIDNGLFSADLRARERMGQLLTQVSGRAGRGARRGEVLVQTYYPDNPIYEPLLQHDYASFAANLMQEREAMRLPPFGYVAMIRADSPFADRAEHFLIELRNYLTRFKSLGLMGPLPALLGRRAGKHRYMLLVQSQKRSQLHEALTPLHRHYPRQANQVSWHIDIDPAELA